MFSDEFTGDDRSKSAEAIAANERRRKIAFAAVLVTQLMIVLDIAIVNVALPDIKSDLNFTQSSLTWVSNGYAIAYGGFLLVAGRLGDLLGRKLVLVGGLLLFVAASITCGLSVNAEMLVASRFVQGVGGAACSGVTLAVLISMFPQPAERAKAMSSYILVSVSGASVGLLAGGVLAEISWHWIFFVNVPLGLAIVAVVLHSIPAHVGDGLHHGVDVLGGVLVTAAAMLFTYGIVTSEQFGVGSAHTLIFCGVGLVLAVVFVWWQGRAKNPLMPVRVMKLRSLMGSSAVRAILAGAMFSSFFLGSLFFSSTLGYTSLQVGLAFLPHTIAAAIVSRGVATGLMSRFGSLQTLVLGMVIAAAGMFLLSGAQPAEAYFPRFPVAFTMMGFGIATSMTCLLTLAMSEVPAEDAGISSAVVNVSMQLAGAIGMAVLGTLASTHAADLVKGGTSPLQANADGFQLALTSAAVLILLAIPVSIWILRSASTKVSAQAKAAAPAAAEA